MNRAKVFAPATLLLAGLTGQITVSARTPPPLVIAKGAQVGVVNLLNGEIMHYHSATDSNGAFLKMVHVEWPIDELLIAALKEPATQLGLTLTKAAPIDALEHSRESCFVNASLAEGLPKACISPLQNQATSAGVSYLIIMAPGLNDAKHARDSRLKEISALMRGWGFQTSERAGSKDLPTLCNEVELLFVSVGPEGVILRARQWGGRYFAQWDNYTLPPDLHHIPAEQVEQLQPLYAAMLSRQAKDLLNQIHVEP
jgi:hypothetical protein